MRRVHVFALLVVVLSLVAGPAAAIPQHHPPGHQAAPVIAAPTYPPGSESAAPRSSGTTTVSGTITDSSGNPVADSYIEWWSFDAGAWHNGFGSTDASGSYSLTVATGTNGWIYVSPGNGQAFLGSGGYTWAEHVSYGGVDIRAGAVNVAASRGGPWGDFGEVWVYFWNDLHSSLGTLKAPDGTTTPVQGPIDIAAGDYVQGNAYFFLDEGLELSGLWNIPWWATCSTALTVNEADAQRVSVTSPTWASGKPGATVKVSAENFPAGWIDKVSGHTNDDGDPAGATYPDRTSSGPGTEILTLAIPRTASPGHGYHLVFKHSNGQASLELSATYQVCTIKPSKSSIHKGAKIRVTGVVPVEGHRGTTLGTPKTVTLFAHKGKARVPTKWNPKSQGWVKICTAKANGTGVYKTRSFKPLRTMTLIVRYPGETEHMGAYTSTARVKVR